MSTLPSCRGCLTAKVRARQLDEYVSVTCKRCGAEYTGSMRAPPSTIAMQRFAPDPLPPLEAIAFAVDEARKWVPNAREDMAALAWSPGSGEIPPSAAFSETDVERELREERRMVRCMKARARLAAMRSHPWWPSVGELYADVVWMVYGVRGEALDARESGAVMVVQQFSHAVVIEYRKPKKQKAGKPREPTYVEDMLAAFKASIAGSVNPAIVDAAAYVGLGNAMIGCAVAAYERDEWDVAVGVGAEIARKNARQTFVERMRASFEAASADIRAIVKRRANSSEG